MLIRIVGMGFKSEKTTEFLDLFESNYDKIRSFEGCLHLELLKDYHLRDVYFTYSYWENDKALNQYRNSDLFQEVWGNTKILFSEKPLAFSMYKD